MQEVTRINRLSKRVAGLQPSGIRKFFDIAATMKDVISLGIGEPVRPEPPAEQGDLVSGEEASGTIRLLLTKPISRTGLLASKFIAGAAYTFCLIVWLGIMAVVVGIPVGGVVGWFVKTNSWADIPFKPVIAALRRD